MSLRVQSAVGDENSIRRMAPAKQLHSTQAPQQQQRSVLGAPPVKQPAALGGGGGGKNASAPRRVLTDITNQSGSGGAGGAGGKSGAGSVNKPSAPRAAPLGTKNTLVASLHPLPRVAPSPPAKQIAPITLLPSPSPAASQPRSQAPAPAKVSALPSISSLDSAPSDLDSWLSDARSLPASMETHIGGGAGDSSSVWRDEELEETSRLVQQMPRGEWWMQMDHPRPTSPIPWEAHTGSKSQLPVGVEEDLSAIGDFDLQF